MTAHPPGEVVAALRALGLPDDAHVIPADGGASGSAWRVEAGGATFAMRHAGSPSMARSRAAAMAAARAAGLPAPEVVRTAPSPRGQVVLLSWLPGVPLLDAVSRAPADTLHYAQQMGELQRRLHHVVAPGDVVRVAADPGHPFAAGRDVAGLPDGDRLLHLDWHPLNLLVDEPSRRIVGIVDWDNARAGHPTLDLARTRSILMLEPGLADLAEPVRQGVEQLVEGWADGYGDEARDIPHAAEIWAGRVMLADLEPRYADRPSALDALRAWTDAVERRGR